MQLRQFFLKLRQPVLTQMIRLFLKSRLLNLHLHNLSGQFIQFCRHGIKFCLDHRTGLIDQIDCLIRKEPVADIAVRKGSRRYQSRVCNLYAVVNLVPLLQSTKD